MASNTWGSIAADVAKAAPILGNLIPGIGSVAGLAVGSVASIVSSALGVPATPDAVATALQTDPDAYVKLHQAEMTHQETLINLSLQKDREASAAVTAQYAAEAADRASARDLAAKQPKDLMRPLLAFGILGLTSYMVWSIMSGHSEGILKDTTVALTVGTIFGYVISELKQVYGFYFGMTKDASAQNSAITDFAVSPGTVTLPTAPTLPALPAPANGSSTLTVQSSDPVTIATNPGADDNGFNRP